MNTSRLFTILVLTVCSWTPALIAEDLCVAPDKSAVDVSKTPIPLCLVAKKISATLDAYNSDKDTAANSLPKLAKAEFEFKTVSSNTTGFKFNILVFSLGATHKGESTNDVTFSYVVPPAPKKPLGLSREGYIGFLASRPKPRDFSKDLIGILQAAAQQIKQTNSVQNASFKTLTVSLSYGATWDFSGGATVPISLVTLGGSLDHSQADTQVVKLTFEDQGPATAVRTK